jgi:rhamnogalacturonyl hydrolase YesR
MPDIFKSSFNKLKFYCESQSFKGYDPFDGLNSKLFRSIPFISKSRIARLIWIQLFKRFPINLRFFVGIKKEYNSKGLALFLSGYCNLYKIEPKEEYLEKIIFLAEELIKLKNLEYSGACWGYNFDWQARAFFQPKNTPTVVATTYIGCAFLDAYEVTNNNEYLRLARSSCDFILTDLNRTNDSNNSFAFSYSPLDNSVVYNASLLGSKLLARVYCFTNEEHLISEAKKSVQFCCQNQNIDGSWNYGKYNFHSFKDSFHTGFNLECINDYMQYSGDFSFLDNLNKGLAYYLQNFFTADGIPKYYNNAIYPIDIHAPAQLVLTLSRLKKFNEQINLINKVIGWTIENMQSKDGFFYYQKKKYFTSRVSYMRWSQSWMFFALTEYFKNDNQKKN